MSIAEGPAQPPGAVIDKEALRQKYSEERKKRLRADGNDQYLRLTGQLARYLDDPHTPVTERRPKTDHVTVAFIGGGFAGLVTGARLKEAGVEDVRIIEKGGDFGGTWYWNRYPGAQCDTASYVYMPLLEETGYMPSEKYAHAPEILEHCQRIGKHFDLYANALFHTEVDDLTWDESRSRWTIRTNRGDEFTAQFVSMGTGPLHVPKLPGIPGIETFGGHSFHTSRWDYEFTGGDPVAGTTSSLAVILWALPWTSSPTSGSPSRHRRHVGTVRAPPGPRLPGAVRLPADPFVCRCAQQPSNRPRVVRRDGHRGMATALAGQLHRQPDRRPGARRPGDGRLDRSGPPHPSRIMALPPEDLTVAKRLEAFEDSDFEKMEEIRARIDSIVEDPETAQDLKAWYRQLCKRPCFHDEYLQAYNQPGTHLVHADGKGVERITETAVVAAGQEYEVDCVIYASGFEVGTEYTRRADYDMTGRHGVKLSEYWAEGMHTLHGIHVHGFPNAFIVQPTQGGNLISNIPHNLTESGQTIACIVKHALDHGFDQVEVTKEAEDVWVDLLLSGGGLMLGSPDCTPGYYNNEGEAPGPQARLNVGYPEGATAYFRYLDQWRSSGTFEGLTFR